ncbi:MAG TPA: cytochrome c, partial [Anaerolineales bacterium]
PEGKPGHYTATLTFPKEGNWEWSIQAFSMDQKMPTLSVAAASVIESKGQSVVKGEAVNESTSLLLIVRVLVFGIGLLGLVIAFQRRSRLVGGLAGVCLLVGFVMVVTAPAVPRVEAQAGLSSEESSASSIPQVEIGRQLFIAKGCITCHINEKATNDGSMTLLMEAPNLSKFSANPEMLRMRLEDPASVKSDTWMPDLDLSSAEIKALIAFVNSK